MIELTREGLLLLLKMTLRMLPRYLRHDLWRTAEPHHARAVDSVAETLAEKIDDGFELEPKPLKPAITFGYLYRGPPSADDDKP